MNRRQFFQSLSLKTALITAPLSKAFGRDIFVPDIESFAGKKLSIMQCSTGLNFTHLSVIRPKVWTPRYQLIDLSNQIVHEANSTQLFTRADHEWAAEHVSFQNLTFGHDYIFQVLSDKNTVVDERRLKLLDVQKSYPRIAFLSCMMDYSSNRDKMWEWVHKSNPDCIFMLGDNVYGDLLGVIGSDDILWNRYVNARERIAFYQWDELKPVFAVWDDHDYGINDGDRSYKFKDDSLKQFRAFFNQPQSSVYTPGVGAGGFVSLFDRQFFMFDCRSERDDQQGGIAEYLGNKQLQWAYNNWDLSKKATWFMQGCQFFGRYTRKSGAYEIFAPVEFLEFQRLFLTSGRGGIFVSGDIHYSEILALQAPYSGESVIEITSSGLHSYHTKSFHKENPRRIAHIKNESFIYADLSPNGRTLLSGVGLNGLQFEKVVYEGQA